MPNTTAITDLRAATRAAIYDLTNRVEQARARLQKLSLDTMTEYDARGVAAEATELANLFATRSQQVNLLENGEPVVMSKRAPWRGQVISRPFRVPLASSPPSWLQTSSMA